MLDAIFSFIGLAILAIIIFVILRFVLRLTARIIGCTVTAVVVIGIAIIVWIFFF